MLRGVSPSRERMLEVIGDGKMNIRTLAFRANCSATTVLNAIKDGVLIVAGFEKPHTDLADHRWVKNSKNGVTVVCAKDHAEKHVKAVA